MKLRLAFILIAVVCTAQPFHAVAEATATIPDTPVGRQFASWLDALNTGQLQTIREFITGHFDKSLNVDEFADSHVGLFLNDGRLELRKIASSSSEEMTVFVQAKPTGYWVEIKMRVAPQPPHQVLSFRYRHVEIPAEMLPRQKLAEWQIRSNLDALVTGLAAADRFSGVVLVAKDGSPFYLKAFGFASRACGVPNRPDTKFNVASITKMWTAVGIEQLVQQGKLSHDDTVGKILPDYTNKEVAMKVTIHHLLTHTSGLGSKSLGVMNRRYRTLKDYLPSFVNQPPAFIPGEKYDYSNDGYLLLGAIIEKVSGQDYYSYIRQHIYEPAGMTNSDSYELDADPPNLASGYTETSTKSRRNNIFSLPVKGLPFGLGYSTVEDLLKFHMALQTLKLLSAESLALAWAGKVNAGPDTKYGYGFDIREYNGTRIIGHSGGWSGITNQMDMYPDLGYTVVILTNYDDLPKPLAMKLREWLTQGHS